MAIFVTGGAGFIGSKFVLDWLAQCDEPVINSDKLSYNVNLENLANLQGDTRHLFVLGDLGDNIFYGHDFHHLLANAMARTVGGSVFAYHVHDPERYGVAEFDAHGKVLSLEEKPRQPKSNYAVTGLYFYDDQVVDWPRPSSPLRAANWKSPISIGCIWDRNNLAWRSWAVAMPGLDTGTHESLLDVSQFIATLENRQGLKVVCPEEIAYRKRWISAGQLEALAQPLTKNGYGQYLLRILKENVF